METFTQFAEQKRREGFTDAQIIEMGRGMKFDSEVNTFDGTYIWMTEEQKVAARAAFYGGDNKDAAVGVDEKGKPEQKVTRKMMLADFISKHLHDVEPEQRSAFAAEMTANMNHLDLWNSIYAKYSKRQKKAEDRLDKVDAKTHDEWTDHFRVTFGVSQTDAIRMTNNAAAKRWIEIVRDGEESSFLPLPYRTLRKIQDAHADSDEVQYFNADPLNHPHEPSTNFHNPFGDKKKPAISENQLVMGDNLLLAGNLGEDPIQRKLVTYTPRQQKTDNLCEEGDAVCALVSSQKTLDTASSKLTPQDDAEVKSFNNKLNNNQKLTSAEQTRYDELQAKYKDKNDAEDARNRLLAQLFGVDVSALKNTQEFYKQDHIWAVIGTYQSQLLNPYGIDVAGYDWGVGVQGSLTKEQTFTNLDQIVARFETLLNYKQGAQMMAHWLKTTFADQLGKDMDMSEAEAFTLIMGKLKIERTKNKPAGATDPSIGFTGDHIVYDRFDVDVFNPDNPDKGIRAIPDHLPAPMTAGNFLHELAHAFVNSGGFGTWLDSPVYDGEKGAHSTLTQRLDDILGNLLGGPGEGKPGTPNEALANLIESLANGRLDFNTVLGELEKAGINTDMFKANLNRELINNVLRNTPPQAIAQELNTSAITASGLPERPIFTSPGGNEVISGQTTSQVTILAKSSDETRLYIAVDRGGWYDYGWAARNDVSVSQDQLNSLEIRTIEGTQSFAVQECALQYNG